MEQTFRPVLTIRIFGEEKCFGPGVAILLRKVRELHSLRAAAMSIGMAYSKAWTILTAAFRVPLADVARLGCRAIQLPTGVRLDIERADELPDVPKPLDARSAAIAETMPSLNRFPIYRPRAVSMSLS